MNRYLTAIILIVNIGFVQAQYTAIPDSLFEQQLIDQGIDTEAILDGQVLTADIDFITELTLYNDIVSLQGIEGFNSLEILDINECLVQIMDLSQNFNLSELYCQTSFLYELDLTSNINLEVLDCYNGTLSNLNLEGLQNLSFVNCAENYITNLNVLDCPNLETLICHTNGLTEINVNESPILKIFILFDNNLDLIAISENPLLETFDCSFNTISSLNIENNSNLKTLYCNNNSLTELNLNNNSVLEVLNCKDNDLQTLYIQNGANELLTGTYVHMGNEVQRFNSLSNTNLTCIFVDDATYCEENWVDYDPTSNFVETQNECDAISVDDYSFENTIKLYPNPADNSFYIEENQVVEQVNIYSNVGELIKAFNNQKVYQVSKLTSGMYFVKIYYKNGIIKKKLLKK